MLFLVMENKVRFDPVVYSVREGSGSVFFRLNGTTTFPVNEQVQIRLNHIAGSAEGSIS